MAYPQIASYTQGSITTNALSTTITVPSGTQAGDLMLLLIAKDGTGIFTVPSGWAALANASSSAQAVGILYTKLTAPLSDFTISHASELTAWILLRIPNGYIPTISSATTGSSVSPDPASLTHTFGNSRETLWIATANWDASVTCTSYAGNFTANRITQISNHTGGCGIAMATLESVTNPQDPWVFTLSSTETWQAYTLAIVEDTAIRVASYTSGFTTVDATSTSITVPSGTQANDLMLLLISKDGTDTFTTPANWTQLANAGLNGVAVGIFYRRLTATLSGFTISHASEMAAWILLRIPEGSIPQVSSAVTGTANGPNPPSLTHTFPTGAVVLWIAFAGWDFTSAITTVLTYAFRGDRYAATSTDVHGTGVGVSTHKSTTNPTDPAAYMLSQTAGHYAYTIALYHTPVSGWFQLL